VSLLKAAGHRWTANHVMRYQRATPKDPLNCAVSTTMRNYTLKKAETQVQKVALLPYDVLVSK
jgi:hypothetical protein